MSNIPNVEGKAAVRVTGRIMSASIKGADIDCDGDQAWFPKGTYRVVDKNTIDIQKEWFERRFPNG